MVKTLLGVLISVTLTRQPVYKINYLIEHAPTRDQQSIIIEGEVIGEVLERGDHAWLNVNDGSNAIGIYLKLEDTKQIKVFGDYFHTGDVIRINGVFNRACIQHGGEMDIHATTISVIKPGSETKHDVSSMKFVLSIILFTMSLAAIYLKRHYFRKRNIETDLN